MGINWGVVFPFGIWGLWLHRNSVVFGKERTQIVLKKEVMAKAIEFSFLGANGRHGCHRTTIKISWQRPPENWVNLGLARGGGLIHNANGEWVRGFARDIGTTSSAVAELWAF